MIFVNDDYFLYSNNIFIKLIKKVYNSLLLNIYYALNEKRRSR